MSALPDVYVGPAFVGWRSWRILPLDRLGKPSTVRLAASGTAGLPKFWEPGVPLNAVCGKFDTTHEAPSPDCECGVYAYRTRDDAWEHLQTFVNGTNGTGALGWAFGRVSLWGRMVECERGWRAEHAYPYSLEVYAPEDVAGQLRRVYGVDVGWHDPIAATHDDEAADDEQDEQLSALVERLDGVKARLGAVDEWLKLLEYDGQIKRETFGPLGSLNFNTVSRKLRLAANALDNFMSVTSVTASVLIDIEAVTKDVDEILRHAEDVARRISGVAPARPKTELEYVPRLRLDDDEVLVAAVAQAVQHSYAGPARRDHRVAALEVAHALAGIPSRGGINEKRRVRPSDVIRVGQALGRLARNGRIEFASKPGERRLYTLDDERRD